MASIQILPATGGQNKHGFSRLTVPVKFNPPSDNAVLPDSLPLRTVSFIFNNNHYVLTRHLAALWNYPSSYQVIAKILKGSAVSKDHFLHESTSQLNSAFVDNELILPHDANKKQFYISVPFIYLILDDKLALVGTDSFINNEKRKRPVILPLDDETITVSQVFPQYGKVESTIPLDHASFLALTPLTKLQVYKHEGNYRRVFGTALSANERELLITANNITQYHPSNDGITDLVEPITQTSSSKKALGRSKKQAGLVDPNTLDVSENILPGNGQIPDFQVTPICKVPNYFVTNGQMSAAQQNALFNTQLPHLHDLKLEYEKTTNIPKEVQQLLLNNDQDNFSSKYYYYKSYRGPGSGNYKDAALVNRINKIRTFTAELAPKNNSITHLPSAKVTKPLKRRFNRPVKGLTHDFYSPENVEITVDRQRKFTEDYVNLEMLHNNILFNLLVNSYREVLGEVWRRYYDFKLIDFEKLYSMEKVEERNKRRETLLAAEKQRYEMQLRQVTEARQKAEEHRQAIEAGEIQEPMDMETSRELNEPMKPFIPSRELQELMRPDPTRRFTLPSEHPEIMRTLPVELRGETGALESALSKPIRYTVAYPDRQFLEALNQIEVIKLPNANSIGWDNIKKYRSNI